ncbi:MAG: metallophosphoesterase [Verrucomicrobia bacterium]|nr:metallophosphoesterase [Verrucomicrobiota bacterium]
MPGIFYQPVDRRRFLRTTSQALAAFVVAAEVRVLAADAAAPEKPIHLALLSDTHIPADPKNEYRNFFPYENLKSVVPQVIAARPEGVIINGDAARLTGEVADYEALKALLAPVTAQAPVYIGLGNHDDRDNFAKVFDPPARERQQVTGKHVLVIEWPALRLIVLDSLLYVNKVAGLLGKAQREWLARFLAASDARPLVLFVHHTLRDGDGDLLDVGRLFDLIRPHKKVKAIFYGHSHEYAFAQENGVHLVNLPAVGYNFKDTEPVGWVDAVFTSKGVELVLKAFAGDRSKDGKAASLAWVS